MPNNQRPKHQYWHPGGLGELAQVRAELLASLATGHAAHSMWLLLISQVPRVSHALDVYI